MDVNIKWELLLLEKKFLDRKYKVVQPEFDKFYYSHKLVRDISTKNIDEEQVKKLPEKYSKLFRKICLLTHPDKIQNNNRISKIFEKCSNAKTSVCIHDIVICADKLGIDVSEDIRKDAIFSLEKEISEKKSSYWYYWSYSDEYKKVIESLFEDFSSDKKEICDKLLIKNC